MSKTKRTNYLDCLTSFPSHCVIQDKTGIQLVYAMENDRLYGPTGTACFVPGVSLLAYPVSNRT